MSTIADAFNGVAASMMAKNQAHLERSIAQSRTAYTALKKVCPGSR